MPEGRSFTFDHAFGPQTTQKQLFDEGIQPLVEKFLSGYNATVLAYGQTSSGKTYTTGTSGMNIEEEKEGERGREIPEEAGIIHRAAQAIFDHLSTLTSSASLYVSFVELYHEELIDLLSQSEGSGAGIQIREDPRGRIYCTGLREVRVEGVDDVLR